MLNIQTFQMKKAITAELKSNCLQVNNHTLTKVIQLYETKTSRHSVMIVGNTQSGKTVSWRMLQATMTRLNKEGASYQAVKVSYFRACLYAVGSFNSDIFFLSLSIPFFSSSQNWVQWRKYVNIPPYRIYLTRFPIITTLCLLYSYIFYLCNID